MGELVSCAIAPHGVASIEEISGNMKEKFKKTSNAMKKFGESILATKPDTIVILTPHGLRLDGYNAIYTCEFCRGNLAGNNKIISLEHRCNRDLAKKILLKAKSENIPSVGCNYGALEGSNSNIEMDWGTFIPLWFCREENYNPEIVVIGPSRDIELNKLVRLGEIIAEEAKVSDKKVTLIASADQGHCHDPNGPYGFNQASEKYDKTVLEIIKENKLEKLLDIDMELVESGKPDSLWQMLILHGALNITPMECEVLSYDVPTYFGMIVANYYKI